MRALLSAVIGGLLLGGIIHIAIVLMVPLYAANDAWARIQDFDARLRFAVLEPTSPDEQMLPGLDPRMAHALCRFNLDNGPVHVSVAFPDDFWSVAVFDRRGHNIYSLNDGSAERSRQLVMALITPVQMAQLRRNPPEVLETAIVVERQMTEGFVLLRAFVPDDAAAETVAKALDEATCRHDF